MVSMYRSSFFLRVTLALLAIAVLTAGFTGCPRNIQTSGLGKAAIVLSGNLAPTKGGDVSNNSLAALIVTVGDIVLEQEDGTLISVLPAPIEVDLLSDTAGSTILAAADIPAGVYVGGTLVLTSATLEYENDPGVPVPVGLPAGGEFSVEAEFEVIADGQGVLKLELDDIEIHVLGDDSLLLDAQFELEAEFDDPDDIDDPDLVIGDIETAGVIDDVEVKDSTFEMEIGDSEIEVDYSTATILLPPATEGGEPIVGTPEDLVEDACVNVAGVLNLDDDDLVLVADTVQIVAYNCDDDGDDFDDHDDDDDDDDGDDDDDDDDDDEDDDDED